MSANGAGERAAMPVEFTIDGRPVTGAAGEPILQVAKRHGI